MKPYLLTFLNFKTCVLSFCMLKRRFVYTKDNSDPIGNFLLLSPSFLQRKGLRDEKPRPSGGEEVSRRNRKFKMLN